MFEIDFLPVGDGERNGDAIAVRYTNPDGPGHVVGVIDAGFSDDGEAVVEHVNRYYDTDSVDFVLSTHPDEDHISGLGTVMRELHVGTLLIHRPEQHGYPSNTGARPAEELAKLATNQGARVVEPFTGTHGFGGSLLIAGPSDDFYREMLSEQQRTSKSATATASMARRSLSAIAATTRSVVERFPGELLFDDAGGTNPRNNSAAIPSLQVEGKHLLFTSDAGVPAISEALDYLDTVGRTSAPLNMLALPHHGSRHNLDRDIIERLLGSHTNLERGTAVASVARESDMPSPRIANAAGRRGYPVFTTAGKWLLHSEDAPPRPGWGPATALPPLVENDHD